MATFLTLTDGHYAINLESVTNIELVDDDLKLYFTGACDSDLFGDDVGQFLPGIDAESGLSTPEDLAVWVSPTAEKYQAVLAWWQSNTL